MNVAPDQAWKNSEKLLVTDGKDSPSHADNGDFNRDRFVDANREGHPVTFAQSSAACDFTSLSQGDELGYTDSDSGGLDWGPTTTPDPWGIQAPIGGTPDPQVGRPRKGK